MLTLIKNGYIIDPASDREGIYDLLIEDDRIKLVEEHIPDEMLIELHEAKAFSKESDQKVIIIDASGKYVMPGFIDLHVHLREPGYEYKETIKSGSMAAAAGGFTTICPMPNTNPPIDSPEGIKLILDKAKEDSLVNILPVGCITLGQEGKVLADIGAMAEAGAVAISEDGKSVMDTSIYEKAMKEAANAGILVFAHCEDKALVNKGVINAGQKADELNLPGISNAVEDVITARDIILAKETGAKLHLCHVSTSDSAAMIKLAKMEGLSVTGEVTPHHFTLSDEDIPRDDGNYKMNPPLRSLKDLEALKEAIKDNVIDAIATDHAPHSREEKFTSFTKASFGIVGLETAFALTMTELVKPGLISPRQMVEKLSANPARILNISKGCIAKGWIADLVIADPEAVYNIDPRQFHSKAKHSPLDGRKVTGRITHTFVSGKLKYHDER